MRINIAGGTGDMGIVHTPVFQAAGHEVLISGRQTSPSLEESAQQSDITIVSVPIHATEEVIARVAPYCTAITDFTSLKVFPRDAMYKYAPPGCEISGLHPSYGKVSSIQGRTVISCPTERSGKKYYEIVRSLQSAGAEIKIMTPEEHDLKIGGQSQNLRLRLLEVLSLSLLDIGMNMKDFYTLSLPPTRILLDLLARQIDSKSAELYQDMRDYNPNSPLIHQRIIDNLERARQDPETARRAIEHLFGVELGPAQERARRLIEGK